MLEVKYAILYFPFNDTILTNRIKLIILVIIKLYVFYLVANILTKFTIRDYLILN